MLACKPDFADTAAYCDKYGYDPAQCANTILVAGKANPTKFAACVVLATTKLDVNKKVCQELGVKRASFADGHQTEKLTGMMIGGVTVFGLPLDLPVLLDSRLQEADKVIMGGGNRVSKILITPLELLKLPNAQVITDLAITR